MVAALGRPLPILHGGPAPLVECTCWGKGEKREKKNKKSGSCVGWKFKHAHSFLGVSPKIGAVEATPAAQGRARGNEQGAALQADSPCCPGTHGRTRVCRLQHTFFSLLVAAHTRIPPFGARSPVDDDREGRGRVRRRLVEAW